MTPVECRETPVGTLLGNNFREGAVSRGSKYLRTIVNQLGIRISCAQQQAMRELAVQGELSRMINGVAAVGANDNIAEIRIHADQVVVGIELIDAGVQGSVDEQMFSARAHISGRED